VLDSRWLDAALFVLPAIFTVLALCGHAGSEYPTCRDGLRVVRTAPLGALLASAMLYLESLLLTAAAAALLLHA